MILLCLLFNNEIPTQVGRFRSQHLHRRGTAAHPAPRYCRFTLPRRTQLATDLNQRLTEGAVLEMKIKAAALIRCSMLVSRVSSSRHINLKHQDEDKEKLVVSKS